jgi:hypothetical protein
MPMIEALSFGDYSLAGEISVWDEEAGTNIETKELPGYEGVHIPDIRRGARIIHLSGKVLADSPDDARADMDTLGLMFGTRELQPLYFATDRFCLCYVQHWKAGFDDQVATAITWEADLYAPLPLWTDAAESTDTFQLAGGAGAQAFTSGLAIDCGAPTWPEFRLYAKGPGSYLWEWFGANLLRNTTFTQGQNPAQVGVPLYWTSDNFGDAQAYLAYAKPSAQRPAGPGFSAGALGSMMLQGAPGQDSVNLWQAVPFTETGQDLSAFVGFRSGPGAEVTLSLQALDAGGSPLGEPVTASVATDGTYMELAASGLTTPADTAAVQWMVTAANDGPIHVQVDRPALVRCATGFWPGHSTYTSWGFVGDTLPLFSCLLLDCLHHQADLFLPNADLTLATSSPTVYTPAPGTYPVALPLPEGAQYHQQLSQLAGGAGALEMVTAWKPNYWGP